MPVIVSKPFGSKEVVQDCITVDAATGPVEVILKGSQVFITKDGASYAQLDAANNIITLNAEGEYCFTIPADCAATEVCYSAIIGGGGDGDTEETPLYVPINKIEYCNPDTETLWEKVCTATADAEGNVTLEVLNETDTGLACETQKSSELLCKKWQTVEVGLDNGGIPFATDFTAEITNSDGSTTIFDQTASGSYPEQQDQWAATLQGLYPDCAVSKRWNAVGGGGGVDGPPDGVAFDGLFALYTHFTCCPTGVYPVSSVITSGDDAGTTFKMGFRDGPMNKGFQCVTCTDDGLEFGPLLNEDGTPVPDAELPPADCIYPCDEELPVAPTSTTEALFGCDDGTDPSTPVIALFDKETLAIEYFIDDGDGTLVGYEIIGGFVNCETGEPIEFPEPEPIVTCNERELGEVCYKLDDAPILFSDVFNAKDPSEQLEYDTGCGLLSITVKGAIAQATPNDALWIRTGIAGGSAGQSVISITSDQPIDLCFDVSSINGFTNIDGPNAETLSDFSVTPDVTLHPAHLWDGNTLGNVGIPNNENQTGISTLSFTGITNLSFTHNWDRPEAWVIFKNLMVKCNIVCKAKAFQDCETGEVTYRDSVTGAIVPADIVYKCPDPLEEVADLLTALIGNPEDTCCPEEELQLNCETCGSESEVIFANGTYSLASGGEVTVDDLIGTRYTGPSQAGCGEALPAGAWAGLGFGGNTNPIVLSSTEPMSGIRIYAGNVNDGEEFTITDGFGTPPDCFVADTCGGFEPSNTGYTYTGAGIGSFVIDYGFETPITSALLSHNAGGAGVLLRFEIINCLSSGERTRADSAAGEWTAPTLESLQAKTVDDLRKEATSMAIDSSGLKAELVKRIFEETRFKTRGK